MRILLQPHKMLYTVWICFVWIGIGCLWGCEHSAGDLQNQTKNVSEDAEEVSATQLFQNYQRIYGEAKQYKSFASLEAVQYMVTRFGEAGYAAVDLENEVNMVHPEQFLAFNKLVEEKAAGIAKLLVVMYNGNLIQYVFHTVDGKVTAEKLVMAVEDEHVTVNGQSSFDVLTWKCAQDYLFFERYYPQHYDGPSGHTAVRLAPLENRCRALCRQYVESIGYQENTMFITDWTEEEYAACNGEFPQEEVIPPPYPYPEVIAYEDNADGTITMTVQAVWPEYNTQCAFVHRLTVRPAADGTFQYVSNQVISSEYIWEKYFGEQ